MGSFTPYMKTMSEEWISNSGELEATMAGIEEEDKESTSEPGDSFIDENDAEWIVTDDGDLAIVCEEQ